MGKMVLKSVYFNGSVRDILISGKKFAKVERPLPRHV